MKLFSHRRIDWRNVFLLALIGGIWIVVFVALNQMTAILNGGGTILQLFVPFFISFALCFVLLPLKKQFEKVLKGRLRSASIVATTLTLLVAFVALVLFSLLLIPQLVNSLQVLGQRTPDYATRLITWINQYIDSTTIQNQLLGFANALVPSIQSGLDQVKSFLTEVLVGFVPFIIQIFLTISFLAVLLNHYEYLSRSMRRLLYASLPEATVKTIREVLANISFIFHRYLVGQLLDALLVGVVTFVAMVILRLPYALLIGFVIALTNMIPFFGPFIGAVPSALLILIVDPLQALIFIIMILVIQQIDGNLIAPMIVGESLSIPPIYILFSITVGGALFGVLGMLIGVPTFTSIMMLFKRFILYLERRKKALDASA